MGIGAMVGIDNPLENLGGEGVSPEEAAAAARARNSRMVDKATEGVRNRVTDIEEFLATALHDAEITGRAADYLRRLVRTVGQVDFGDDANHAAIATQTEDSLMEGLIAGGRRKSRGRRKRASSSGGGGDGDGEPPVERMLRLSRQKKLKNEMGDGRVLPPRIASRTVMQLMLDKASRGQSDSLPEFLYNFYLHMYGVRKLAEQNLVALLLSCAEHSKDFPRLATFSKICGVLEEPPAHAEADAELVCNMYAELNAVVIAHNKELTGSPSVIADNRLPTGDDGNTLIAPVAQCRATVRELFAHIHSLHIETFEDIVGFTESLQSERTVGKGKPVPVVDVDALVAAVLSQWHTGRSALREQVGALFSAGDINNDGVLSFDEFTALVKVVLPSATEERIWLAFRDCIDQGLTHYDDNEPGEQGIQADHFVSVIETHGLLGANFTQASLAKAEKEMLKWKAPVHGSTRDLGKLLLGDNATHRRDRSGRNDHNSHSIDQHDQLRMELLLFEWTDAANKMEEQV